MRLCWRPRNAQASVLLVAGLIAVPAWCAPRPRGPRDPVHRDGDAPRDGDPRRDGGRRRGAAPLRARPVPGRARTDHQRRRWPGHRERGRPAHLHGERPERRHSQRAASEDHAGLVAGPGLPLGQPARRARPRAGQVAAGIPAGGTGTFHVAARVARTPPRLLRLATVACASAQGGSRPIVCAAHLDRLPAAAAASAPRAAGPAGTVPLAGSWPPWRRSPRACSG